jgi:capsular polysaccharide biosynthesis protein
MFTPYPTPHDDAPVLLPHASVRRRLPANFDRADLPLFAHELARELPPTRLLELRDVGVSPDGTLFKGWRILPESFSSPVIMRHFLGRRRSVLKFLATNRMLRPRRRLAGARLWVTDDWSYGYFHWLADALPRLYAARDLAARTTLLLPAGFERMDFVQTSLKLFGVPRVEYVPAGEVCICERLIVPTHTAPSGHYREDVARGLRDLFAEGFGAPSAAGERVYISRGRAPKRKVANEPEILDALREFGFRVVHFEEHPFAEQVRIAQGARLLVSNHGAGLTNMLFMPAGGSVLELRRAGESERNWFFNLASAMGITYFYQNCPPADPAEGAHTGDLFADPQLFRANLEKMVTAAG